MKKIVVQLTDEQAEQFRSAIEVLDPIGLLENFEDMMTIVLIEEFCRNMGVGWTWSAAVEIEEQQNG